MKNKKTFINFTIKNLSMRQAYDIYDYYMSIIIIICI